MKLSTILYSVSWRTMAMLFCTTLMLAAGVGCQSRVYDASVVARETYTVNSPYQVFNTPAVTQKLADQRAEHPDDPTQAHSALPEQTWYARRHDASLNVRQPQVTAEDSYFIIKTRDHYYSTPYGVFDYHRRHTRTGRRGEADY